MSFCILNLPLFLPGRAKRNSTTPYRTKPTLNVSLRLSSVLVQAEETGDLSEPKRISCSESDADLMNKLKPQKSNFINQTKTTVGIIGGVSAFSTLVFLEKLLHISSKERKESLPFIIHSDQSACQLGGGHISKVIESLRGKRLFLEQSGAGFIVMPCPVLHAWHKEIFEGSTVPFLNLADCVARELKEANLKPIEAGSNIRIGVIATYHTLNAGFYQQKLQNQGFEVVLPDKTTMEHIVIPAMEALKRRDVEGARNLLRVAIQLLLVRGVNMVILASDELLGLLPHGDPLLKKCIDPIDVLARSTVEWAKPAKNMKKKTRM